MLIYLAISIVGVRNAFGTALAMEQTAQCGLTEHVHESACYDAIGLVCTQTVHSHTENCYLVRLADNNINALLDQVDEQESNNLQMLIDDTVEQASGYVVQVPAEDTGQLEDTGQKLEDAGQAGTSEQQDSSPQAVLLGNQTDNTDPEVTQTEEEAAPEEEQTEPTSLDVAALNEAIVQNDIQPALVLNEDLYKSATSDSTALLTQQAVENTTG